MLRRRFLDRAFKKAATALNDFRNQQEIVTNHVMVSLKRRRETIAKLRYRCGLYKKNG